MARIPLTGGFTVVPEGEHIFRIYKVNYEPDYGKIAVHLVNAQGVTHRENYNLMHDDGSPNDGACNAFSFFAKKAMNDYSLEEIDPAELVDRYIKARVEHTVKQSNTDPTKTVTFAQLTEKWSADGFDMTPVPRALSLGHEEGEQTLTTRSRSQSAAAQKTGLDDFDLANWLKG